MIRQMTLAVLMSLCAVAAFAQAPGNDSGRQMPQQMQQMQGRMQAMQALMAQIQETDDPAERQRLMQQHMDSLHQGMMMMGRMMQGGMMPRGSAQQCGNGDTQCQMNQMQMQQRMMGRQMGMMQQMMMQMMEQMMQGRNMPGADTDSDDPAERQ